MLAYFTGPIRVLAPAAFPREVMPNYFMVFYGIAFIVMVIRFFPRQYETFQDVDEQGSQREEEDADTVFYKYVILVTAMLNNCTRVLMRIAWEAGVLVILELSYHRTPETAGLITGAVAFSIVVGRALYCTLGRICPDQSKQVLVLWAGMCVATLLMYPFLEGPIGLCFFLFASVFCYNLNLLRSAPVTSIASVNTMPGRVGASKESLTFWCDMNDLLGVFLGPMLVRYALDSEKSVSGTAQIIVFVKFLVIVSFVDGVLIGIFLQGVRKVRLATEVEPTKPKSLEPSQDASPQSISPRVEKTGSNFSGTAQRLTPRVENNEAADDAKTATGKIEGEVEGKAEVAKDEGKS
jgi:hypothetical protein